MARDGNFGTLLKKATAEVSTQARLCYLFATRKFTAFRDPAAADPWKKLRIDPAEIEWTMHLEPSHGSTRRVAEFDRRSDAGRVVGGNWDRDVRVAFEELPKSEAVERRYLDGVPWEQTDLFDRLTNKIEERGSFDGCTCESELRTRYENIDSLYRSLATDGYKSRAELCPHWDIECRLDVPAVNIARDGTFIKATGSGNHRLAIARILDVDVEVRVVVRHRLWQEIRREIASAGSKRELSDTALDQIGHPDLNDIVPQEWEHR